jgi:hypothetical protein
MRHTLPNAEIRGAEVSWYSPFTPNRRLRKQSAGLAAVAAPPQFRFGPGRFLHRGLEPSWCSAAAAAGVLAYSSANVGIFDVNGFPVAGAYRLVDEAVRLEAGSRGLVDQGRRPRAARGRRILKVQNLSQMADACAIGDLNQMTYSP